MGGNLLSLQRPQPTLLPSPLTPRTLVMSSLLDEEAAKQKGEKK